MIKIVHGRKLSVGWAAIPEYQVLIRFDPDLSVAQAEEIAFVQTIQRLQTTKGLFGDEQTKSVENRKGVDDRFNDNYRRLIEIQVSSWAGTLTPMKGDKIKRISKWGGPARKQG